MKIMLRVVILTFFFGTYLPTALLGAGMGRDSNEARLTLKGIGKIYPVVVIDDGAKPLRLDEQQILTDMELSLRLAGIEIANEDDVSEGEATILNLVVQADDTLDKYGVPILMKSVSLQLYQAVTLIRDSSIESWAVTWEIVSSGYVRKDSLEYLGSEIKDAINSFLNAYLSVNPKNVT